MNLKEGFWGPFLPAILAGLAAGLAEYHTDGNGMFLGRRYHTYQIRHMGKNW